MDGGGVVDRARFPNELFETEVPNFSRLLLGAFFHISANCDAALDVGGGGGDRKRVFLTRARETSRSREKSRAAL